MIWVTADTNVYISSIVFAGLPRRFVDAADEGVFRLAISAPLLAEIHRILLGKFTWPEQRVAEAMLQLSDCTTLVSPRQVLDAVPSDPDDNRVLECALESGSRFIVTGDNDLLRLGSYGGIEIIKVADFMKLLPTL